MTKSKHTKNNNRWNSPKTTNDFISKILLSSFTCYQWSRVIEANKKAGV